MSNNKVEGYTLVNANIKQVKTLDIGVGAADGSIPAVLAAQTAQRGMQFRFTTTRWKN